MVNWVFVTGAPGSFWSGVSQVIRDNWDVDNTDCIEEKTYTHHKYSGHIGNYYGPGLQYGHWLDKELGSLDRWKEEIYQSFDGPEEQIKVILSHNFAYYLPEMQETFPDSTIITVFRHCERCREWWDEAGGFDITYPSYEWYKGTEGSYNKMDHEIYWQNAKISKWAAKLDLGARKPTKDWLREKFNNDVDYDVQMDKGYDVAVYNLFKSCLQLP